MPTQKSLLTKLKKKLTAKELLVIEELIIKKEKTKPEPVVQLPQTMDPEVKILLDRLKISVLDLDLKFDKLKILQLKIRKENLRWLLGIAVGLAFLIIIIGLYFN